MEPDLEWLVGCTLGRSYRVVRLLGNGGMGAVYEARGVRLPDARFAVKTLHGAPEPGSEMYGRFRQEATIISRLGHPHIVRVVDFDHTEQGLPYMVMEYLEGEDLEQRLCRKGALPLARAMAIFSGVGSALQAAHEQRVVHRDIKPRNIFLCRTGQEADFPKILDFGISKLAGADPGLTGSRTTLGTPHYMSPEQARGLSSGADARSDIFSLGAVIYRTLAGTLPFTGESLPGLIFAVTSTEPAPLHRVAPSVPEQVSWVLARALAKDPGARQGSVAELMAELERAAGGGGRESETEHVLALPCHEEPTLRSPASNGRPVRQPQAPGTAPAAGCPASMPAGPPSSGPRQGPGPRGGERRGAVLLALALGLLGLAGAVAFHRLSPPGTPRVATLPPGKAGPPRQDAGGSPGGPLPRALAAEAAELTECFAPALAREPDLEGRLLFRLAFGDRGQVLDVRVEQDDLGNMAVAACALDRLRALPPLPAMAGRAVRIPHHFAPTRTLAVLPFANLAEDPSLEWLRGGMAEALLSRLGQVPTLVLLEQDRLRTLLPGRGAAPLEAGAQARRAREAGAQLLLQGAFQRLGSRLRLTARLSRTSDGKVRAVAEATGELAQVFALQDRLASQLAEALQVGALPSAPASSPAPGRDSLAVLRLLGQAHNSLMEAEGGGSLSPAEALYRQVIDVAGDLPEGHYGLAMALWPRRDGPDGAVNREIRAHLQRALELRPGYYQALSSLGFLLWNEQRYEEAFALQRRALRLKPGYALGYYGLGLGHATRGQGEQALALLQQAAELDPQNSEFRTQLGICQAAFRRDHKAALKNTGAALKLPGAVLWNHVFHALMQLKTGDPRGCLRTLDNSPGEGPYNTPHRGQSIILRAACLARIGETDRAGRLLLTLPSRDRALLADPPPPGLPAYLLPLLADLREALVAAPQKRSP